jgi:hypothetical protein
MNVYFLSTENSALFLGSLCLVMLSTKFGELLSRGGCLVSDSGTLRIVLCLVSALEVMGSLVW